MPLCRERMSLEFIPFPWPIAEPINLEPRASLELQPAVPQRGEVGHGCIEFGKFREAIRECSAFLTMIAVDGGLVAGGDASNSSKVLLVIVNRLVKPTDLLEGYVEVENRW